MYGCESWTVKNWCFWTVVLEKTLESPLDSKKVKPVNPKENQPWIFIVRTDTEAETPILWPPDMKNWLIRKDPDAGKDWRQEDKEGTEDGMVGWHHQIKGHEFEQALGVGDGQGSLACCSPWGHRVGHHWVTELKAPEFCFILIGSITCVSFVPLVKPFGMMRTVRHFPLQVRNKYFMAIFCLQSFLVSQDLTMS